MGRDTKYIEKILNRKRLKLHKKRIIRRDNYIKKRLYDERTILGGTILGMKLHDYIENKNYIKKK